MARSDFILGILQYTPIWVWPLLAALLALGVMQAFPRTVTLRRITVLPVVMLALSLWSVASVFGPGLALAAWALGGLAAVTWSVSRGALAGARWSAAEQAFRLPGSWVPLMLIVGIFCTKFGVGVSLALHPELRSTPAFAIGASLAYGVFSGIFAGRALALLRLARQAGPLSLA